jgi:Radical SAM superfamily
LPALREYAHVVMADDEHRTAGYTEASRGCKHLCRHCPIVPVYAGQFRVVPVEVVLADVRQQVAAGAEHITFGDPDFFNGVTHATRVVEAMHAEFPRLTYDATIKVEHLLRHADQLATLAGTGCLFVTSAVEAVADEILRKLDKGHTRADFFRALDLCEDAGLALQPTFVPFTPWTTRKGYLDLLEVIADRELISAVASVQLAIRLLIPSQSRLLQLVEIALLVREFDAERLVYPWRHPDPTLDALAERVSTVVAAGDKQKLSRAAVFEQIWEAAAQPSGESARPRNLTDTRRGVPFLSEPWYC